MRRRNIETKHYSLAATFSLFLIIMASFVTVILVNTNSAEAKTSKIEYSKIESINPLILENSEKVIDKTDANINLVHEIERVYDIDVIYGDGTEYLADSVDATSIYNQQDINEILLELIDCLEKYPSNIFSEILNEDYTIEICIVDSFNNDNIALATRDSNDNFKIFLSNAKAEEKVKRSIHHETYHILEYYMKLEFDINELYKDWDKYNPEGFTYISDITLLNADYIYELDKYGRHYFVSAYSKVSDKEDRAEVFADTMSAIVKPEYYTDSLGAIKGKMNLISNAIKQSFYSVNYGTSIYWTRYF